MRKTSFRFRCGAARSQRFSVIAFMVFAAIATSAGAARADALCREDTKLKAPHKTTLKLSFRGSAFHFL
jgi:hypothetical protein